MEASHKDDGAVRDRTIGSFAQSVVKDRMEKVNHVLVLIPSSFGHQVLRYMMSELRDDYSTYLSPVEVRAQFASSGGTADMSQVSFLLLSPC